MVQPWRYAFLCCVCCGKAIAKPWAKGDENATCKIDFRLSVFTVWKAHFIYWTFGSEVGFDSYIALLVRKLDYLPPQHILDLSKIHKKRQSIKKNKTLITCVLTLLHTVLTTYTFISILTPWCRVLLEKLTGLQLVKKFPAFYETRKFITAFTSFRHPSLSWASPNQSTCILRNASPRNIPPSPEIRVGE